MVLTPENSRPVVWCCNERRYMERSTDLVFVKDEYGDGALDMYATVSPHKSTNLYYGYVLSGVKFCPFCGARIAQDNDSEFLAEPSVDCYGSGS